MIEDFIIDENGTLTKYTGNDEKVVIPDGTICIGKGVFDSKKIVSISFNEGLKEIGAHAFFMCSSLEDVSFPNTLQTIGENAFLGCGKLTKLTIPASVSKIGNTAFMGCRSLKEVVFEGHVENIGRNVFSKDVKITSLSDFGKEEAPEVESIEKSEVIGVSEEGSINEHERHEEEKFVVKESAFTALMKDHMQGEKKEYLCQACGFSFDAADKLETCPICGRKKIVLKSESDTVEETVKQNSEVLTLIEQLNKDNQEKNNGNNVPSSVVAAPAKKHGCLFYIVIAWVIFLLIAMVVGGSSSKSTFDGDWDRYDYNNDGYLDDGEISNVLRDYERSKK